MGIYEEGDYYAQEDLDLFFANYTPYIPQGTHPTPAFIDGATAPTDVADAGGESDLDFELAYPLLYPQTITLYQTDDRYYATNPNSTSTGGFNTFLDALDGVSGTQPVIANLSWYSLDSHTAPIRLLARPEMTRISIQSTLTLMVIWESFNVVLIKLETHEPLADLSD